MGNDWLDDILSFLQDRFIHKDCGCVVEFNIANPNLYRCMNDACKKSNLWTELPLSDEIFFYVQLYRDGLY